MVAENGGSHVKTTLHHREGNSGRNCGMTVFFLYRLKIERSETPSIFDDKSRLPGEIILEAIEEKPSKELRKGQFWRIGNLQKLSSSTVFFALGKITEATHELYDEVRGDFVARALAEAPHTYVAVDLELQVCAIAQKTKIAPRVDSIAKNLAVLLSVSSVAELGHLEFTLSEISNPDKFLELLRNAIRISEFEMTFSPPNPFDVDRQFHRPMEELLKATHGQQGKTAIKGESLEADVIEDLARSAASTGNKAKARIQSQENEKPSLKYLDGNPVTVSVDELVTNDEKTGLFERIREAYQSVRGTDQPS